MNPNRSEQSSQTVIRNNKQSVDRSVRALMQEMEHEASGGDDTALGRFRKVLKIYRALKPLFAIVGSLPLIPSTWRAAILLFDQALDALADVGGELTAGFKAGRDLEA